MQLMETEFRSTALGGEILVLRIWVCQSENLCPWLGCWRSYPYSEVQDSCVSGGCSAADHALSRITCKEHLQGNCTYAEHPGYSGCFCEQHGL